MVTNVALLASSIIRAAEFLARIADVCPLTSNSGTLNLGVDNVRVTIATPPEACDDGNNVDGDGCAADCTMEEPVPTVSPWSAILLLLLLLTASTGVLLWHRARLG